MHVHAVIGGPGAGKTERLLSIIEKELHQGLAPEQIAFVSFTRRAANEARLRAADKFSLDYDSLEYFRTLHSLCYRQLGLTRAEVMGRGDWGLISEGLGITLITPPNPEEGPPIGGSMQAIVQLAHATRRPLHDVWNEIGGMSWWQLRQFEETVARYKHDTGKLEFHDMLAEAPGPLPVEVAVIDEAQDLTADQWEAADRLFADAQRLYIGGDDDQCLYRWAGADVAQFQRRVRIADQIEVLDKSHRVPTRIFDYAQRIIARVHNRLPKKWRAAHKGGMVEELTAPDQIDLSSGTWYLLARNARFLAELRGICVAQGVSHRWRTGESVDQNHVRALVSHERQRRGVTLSEDDAEHWQKFRIPGIPDTAIWHDALDIGVSAREHYLTILRSGARLQDPARVYVGTIHSVKGGEVDNVLMLTDLAWRTHRSYILAPDDECRVFYVGATRAKASLYIVAGRGYNTFSI